MEKVALNILNRDEIANINFINFNKYYTIKDFYVVGDSVLGRGKSDRNWVYISSNNVSEFTRLIENLNEEDKCYAILEDWMIPYITDRENILWQLRCLRLYCSDGVVLPGNKEHIEILTQEDVNYIFDNYDYKDYASIEYISERIKNGIGLGIHKDNKLVAWILTHDDGAIGFLNVLKEYRRKGYAFELTVALIKKIREIGELPFLHIEENNIKSMNLALKIGFTKDRIVNWFEII